MPVTQQQEPVRRSLNALVVRAAELRLLVSSSFACLYNVALDCSAATGREPPFLAVATLAVLFSHSKPGSSQMQFGSLSTNFSPMCQPDSIR